MDDILTVIGVAAIYWILLIIGVPYFLLGLDGLRKAAAPGADWWERLILGWSGLLWAGMGIMLLIAPTAHNGMPGFIGTLLGAFLAWRFDQSIEKSRDKNTP